MFKGIVLRFQRLNKFIVKFGVIKGFFILQAVRKSRKELVSTRLPGWEHLVWLAPETSDGAIFELVFVDQEYEFSIPNTNPKLIIDAGANVGYTSLFFAMKHSY